MSNDYVFVIIRFAVMCLCLFPTECGRVKRVIGGVEVNCDTQRRVASLRNSTTSKHLCGATILSQHFAMTAAHCVHLPPDYYLLQLNNFCEDQKPRAKVLEVFIHELYDKRSRAHDIALLRISLDLVEVTWLDDSVLPNSSFGVSGDCTIFGYGSIDANVIKSSEKLLAANVMITSLDWCLNALGPIAPEYDSGMMCAGGDGFDACQGDSGSPLICNSLVEGISSYGLSCGVADVPGVYTSIGAHLGWIRDILRNKGSS